jgi:hypothetical protein
MSETRTGQLDPRHDAVARGHEPDPLRVRALVLFVIAFIAFAIVAHVGIWLLLKRYANESRAVDQARSVARPDTGPPAGAPPLQPTPGHDFVPWQDVAAMHEAEDRVFASIGWPVENGRARIPDAVVRAIAARATSRPTSGGGK